MDLRSLCANEAAAFISHNFAGINLIKYWHGTERAAMQEILISGQVRCTNPYERHDFASALYTFREQPFRAAAFGLNRSFLCDDAVGNEHREQRSSVVLLMVGIPSAYVNDHEIMVENFRLSGEELFRLSQLVGQMFGKPADYVTGLNNWQQFVKYCRIRTVAPRVKLPQPIFHGAMHDDKKAALTDECHAPEPDQDGWTQDAIVVNRDLSTEIEGAVFIFFELSPVKTADSNLGGEWAQAPAHHHPIELAEFEAALKMHEIG